MGVSPSRQARGRAAGVGLRVLRVLRAPCCRRWAACAGLGVLRCGGSGAERSPLPSRQQGGLSAAPSRAVSAVKNINLPEIPRNINIGDINIKVPSLSQFM